MFAGALWTGAFVAWVGHLTRWTIDLDTFTDCKLGYFLYEFGSQYSSMLLAVMSIEKLVALYFPLKAKSYCTVGTAKWVTGILAVIMAGINGPVFIWYKAIGKYCSITKHWNYFLMLNTLFYAILPICFMLLANIAIVYKLMYIKYKGISHTNEAVSKSSTRGSVTVVTVSLVFIILTSPRAVDSRIKLKLSRNPYGRLL